MLSENKINLNMKKIFFLTVLLFTQLVAFSQYTFDVTNAEILEAKNHEYDHFRYADFQPEIMCGTYLTGGTTTWLGKTNEYEISVKLNPDGTCQTKYYNSGMVGNVPNPRTTNGTWGLALDKDNKPIIVEENGEFWYRIVLVSNDPNEKLAYYDRSSYYDWINIDSSNNVFLRFVFSSKPKVAKQG